MTNLHITSVLPPFQEEELYPRATRFLRRADAMGLLEGKIEELSPEVVRRVARKLSKRGLASDVAARLTSAPTPSREEFARYLDAALLALNESPVPAAELTKLNSILGHELLADLLEISTASIQRYQSGDREAPDLVADRAHFLTAVISALEGTYNEFGVRRWFGRPRSTFGGRSARQLLTRRWTSHDDSARQVLSAAESLQHLGAT
ncbi:MAG: hypothetical protein JSR66_25250 [Proteobacteria bacterium]|nr:hypothetical protein [Pseudomonadota bacterium]